MRKGASGARLAQVVARLSERASEQPKSTQAAEAVLTTGKCVHCTLAWLRELILTQMMFAFAVHVHRRLEYRRMLRNPMHPIYVYGFAE